MPAARSRSQHRSAFSRLTLLLVTGLTMTVLTACSSENQATEDAYKIGCPALDAAVAGGSVANRAAVKGLQALRDSGQLDPDPQKWVEAAIGALQSGSVEDMPAEARKLLVKGCADHGQALRNLR